MFIFGPTQLYYMSKLSLYYKTWMPKIPKRKAIIKQKAPKNKDNIIPLICYEQ